MDLQVWEGRTTWGRSSALISVLLAATRREGGSEREIQFSGWRGVEIKKVDAECEYLGECGSCVWAVDRRMGNKWVSQLSLILITKLKH